MHNVAFDILALLAEHRAPSLYKHTTPLQQSPTVFLGLHWLLIIASVFVISEFSFSRIVILILINYKNTDHSTVMWIDFEKWQTLATTNSYSECSTLTPFCCKVYPFSVGLLPASPDFVRTERPASSNHRRGQNCHLFHYWCLAAIQEVLSAAEAALWTALSERLCEP